MTHTDIPATTLERVRKLLAKAEGTDNEHERDAFMNAAALLMAKYGIEQAHLGSDPRRHDKPISRVVTVEDGAWIDRRIQLIFCVAEAMRCTCVCLPPRFEGNPTDRKALHLFGFECDIERAEVMYTSLLLQMAAALNRLVVPRGANARAYRNAWMHGYVNQVVSMIREREARAQQEEPVEAKAGTALVLRDRSLAVQQEFQEAYPKVKKTSSRYSSREGFANGAIAGRRANLGGTSVGGARKALN